MSEFPDYHPISSETERAITESLLESGDVIQKDVYTCGGLDQYCQEIDNDLPRRLKTTIDDLLQQAYPSWDPEESTDDPLLVVHDGLMIGMGFARVSLDGKQGGDFGNQLQRDLCRLSGQITRESSRVNLSQMLPRYYESDDVFEEVFECLPDSLFEKYEDDEESLKLYAAAVGYVVAGVVETLVREAIKQNQPFDRCAQNEMRLLAEYLADPKYNIKPDLFRL